MSPAPQYGGPCDWQTTVIPKPCLKLMLQKANKTVIITMSHLWNNKEQISATGQMKPVICLLPNCWSKMVCWRLKTSNKWSNKTFIEDLKKGSLLFIPLRSDCNDFPFIQSKVMIMTWTEFLLTLKINSTNDHVLPSGYYNIIIRLIIE